MSDYEKPATELAETCLLPHNFRDMVNALRAVSIRHASSEVLREMIILVLADFGVTPSIKETVEDIGRMKARISALECALQQLVSDLETRATWNLDGTQKVVSCGAGVYTQAKSVLEER